MTIVNSRTSWGLVKLKDCSQEILGLLEEVDECQQEIQTLDRQYGLEKSGVDEKYLEIIQPWFDKRGEHIAVVPSFWYLVFLNHHSIASLVVEKEKDGLKYLANLQVEDFRGERTGCCISFYFKTNPYFTNTVLTKTYVYGHPCSESSTIDWLPGRGHEFVGSLMVIRDQLAARVPTAHASSGGARMRPAKSFFIWLMENGDPGEDEIAEVIRRDLWVNPQQYFKMNQANAHVNDSDHSSNEEVDGYL